MLHFQEVQWKRLGFGIGGVNSRRVSTQIKILPVNCKYIRDSSRT